ncbi:MAG: indolepyruvate ferredoxin oxidoreductase subunit alpha [Promethearchaeota archaeon]
MTETQEKIWYKVVKTIVKAGQMPMPISDTLIELIQNIITLEQAKFISSVFKKPSLNIDQIKSNTTLNSTQLNQMLNVLMDNGVVVGLPSRRTSIMVYRLLGPFPGMFEYTNLKGETDEKHKKLARLFEKVFVEMREGTQNNYENFKKQFEKYPPVVRIVPVEEEIEDVPTDKVMPHEEVSKIVDKYDDIALAYCYCRHSKDLLDDPCKVTDERLNCFLLGKSAQFAIAHKFGNPVSKKKAKDILKKASDEGLVHKAFHIHLNTELDEEAICNCCSCCCGIFQLHFRGVMPYHCYTNYLAKVNEEKCIGCETCIEICPMHTIDLIDVIAKVNESKCIGCGLCAHHCPEKAIELKRVENREVFIPPPRIKIT